MGDVVVATCPGVPHPHRLGVLQLERTVRAEGVVRQVDVAALDLLDQRRHVAEDAEPEVVDIGLLVDLVGKQVGVGVRPLEPLCADQFARRVRGVVVDLLPDVCRQDRHREHAGFGREQRARLNARDLVRVRLVAVSGPVHQVLEPPRTPSASSGSPSDHWNPSVSVTSLVSESGSNDQSLNT